MAYTTEEIEQKLKKVDEVFTVKEYDNAVILLNNIIENNPEVAIAYRKMGAVFMNTNNPQQAIIYFKKAIEIAQDDMENWIALGRYYKDIKLYKEALDIFQKILELFGEHAIVLYEAFIIHRILGNQDIALSIIQKLLKLAPNDTAYIYEYAKLLQDLDKKKESLTQYNILLNESTGETKVSALGDWLDLMLLFRYTQEAHKKLKTISEQYPNNSYIKTLYARSYEAIFNNEKALEVFLESYELNSNDVGLNYNLGIIYAQNGNIDKAKVYHEHALEIDPLYTPSMRSLVFYEKASFHSNIFTHLQYGLVHKADLSEDSQVQLHYALGKFFDDNNELKLAFEHYKIGGKLHAKGRNEIEVIQLQAVLDTIKKLFPLKKVNEKSNINIQSTKAVFIVGMPRSGTSLIEQVLSSLNNIYGAGELSYLSDVLSGMKIEDTTLDIGRSLFENNQNIAYLERGNHYLEMIENLTSSDIERIIDKMPDNFKFLGFLHLILPHAHIIHSRRHPVEICLSAYRLYFPNGHYWSDDLRSMGKYYRLYHNIMQFWKNVLPEGVILDVFYEKNINDLETQSKLMAKHIGVEWDEQCLKFHTHTRVVRTASVTQVRQPLYKSSINRWSKYEPWLQPLLEEIGDLVKEYEVELEQM